jgi:hypothetical protein
MRFPEEQPPPAPFNQPIGPLVPPPLGQPWDFPQPTTTTAATESEQPPPSLPESRSGEEPGFPVPPSLPETLSLPPTPGVASIPGEVAEFGVRQRTQQQILAYRPPRGADLESSLVDVKAEACSRVGVLGRRRGESVDDCIERLEREEDELLVIFGGIGEGGALPRRIPIPRIPRLPRRLPRAPRPIPRPRRYPRRRPLEPRPPRVPVPLPIPPRPPQPIIRPAAPPLPQPQPIPVPMPTRPPLPPYEPGPLPRPQPQPLPPLPSPSAPPAPSSPARTPAPRRQPIPRPQPFPFPFPIPILRGRPRRRPGPAIRIQPGQPGIPQPGIPPLTGLSTGPLPSTRIPPDADSCSPCRRADQRRREERRRNCRAFIKVRVKAHTKKVCAGQAVDILVSRARRRAIAALKRRLGIRRPPTIRGELRRLRRRLRRAIPIPKLPGIEEPI